MRIRFTPSARLQFLNALEYVHRDNPVAAINLRKRAEKSLRGLVQFPESGRAIPEFPELPYREVLIPPFRFFYRVRGKTVWIAAVWHEAQLLAEPA